MKAECLEAAARCDSSAHDKTENKGKKDHKVLSLSFKFLFRVKGCKQLRTAHMCSAKLD